MVVDASALVAIGDLEPEAETFLQRLGASSENVISVINAVETGLILIDRGRFGDIAELDKWLKRLDISIDHSVTHTEALEAYLTFGRRYHRARLNLGDCFAYALARRLDAPLLYKGDDFPQTDVRSAI